MHLLFFDGNPNDYADYAELHDETHITEIDQLTTAIDEVKSAALSCGNYKKGDRIWFVLWDDSDTYHEKSGSFLL